jgi:hypothetical protein
VSERLRRARRGVRGGVQGGGAPRAGVRGQRPRKKISPGRHISGTTYFMILGDIRWFFGTWFFADGFLFPVKELGFWTNPGHWVRVLDAAGSYMYIVL